MSSADALEVQIGDALVERLVSIVTPIDGRCFPRGLHIEDPGPSIGVALSRWTPVDVEMNGMQYSDPTLQRHRFMIQSLVKETDESDGRRTSTAITKSIRSLVYRDQQLRDALRALREVHDGITETVKKLQVRGTDYFTAAPSGVFTFMSATELWVDIEAR